MAPVELAGLARWERQRHERLGRGGAIAAARLPGLHEALHRAIGAAIPLRLPSLEQALGRPALALRQARFPLQPGLQPGGEFPQLGHRLTAALINRRFQRAQRLADRRSGQLKITGDGADALPAHKVAPSDFGNEFHTQHSR